MFEVIYKILESDLNLKSKIIRKLLKQQGYYGYADGTLYNYIGKARKELREIENGQKEVITLFNDIGRLKEIINRNRLEDIEKLIEVLV